MSGLPFITTKVGRAALINAAHNGTAPLTVTHVGLTAAVFTPDDDSTDLPGEFKRLDTISGEVVAAGTIHVTIRDDSADVYHVRGIGYWLSNGVLLGVYSQPEPILQKSAQSMLLLSADTVFTTLDVTALTFGNANFTNPPATIQRQGVVALASADDTVTGTDATRAVTPAGLTPALTQAVDLHKEEVDPHAGYLTQERGNKLYFHKLEAVTNSDTDCDLLIASGVRDVSVTNDRGILAHTHLPTDGDGYGSLTTFNGGQFIHQCYSNGGTVQRSWSRTGYTGDSPTFNDRPWKLAWDGITFNPDDKQDALGFTPVQQGTGVDQLLNTVKIGWNNKVLKATVDKTDLGSFVFLTTLNAALSGKISGNHNIRLQWQGRDGQPTWVYGGYADPNDGALYNPANFSVHYASNAGNANTLSGIRARYVENPGIKPYYLWGMAAGSPAEMTLFHLSQIPAVHSSGLHEFGSIDPGRTGGTADLPSPFVLVGLRSNVSGNFRVHLRGVTMGLG
ncbi:hypothetical protein [Glaciimonas immobilis]|uniref:Phage tail protein n=1 Tax=Glaciimonas immobilis TaxID=728004 RepID=A0A840RNV7_9BURK|nr:hypothetical protein [Glaciimonas immobilis]KAF3999218.1 hypothetical protein HAV38_04580 [Glaciimonas immobilis]MBB5198676.1 hypothetical protein [Glaciimonas immobilis]